MRKHRAQDPTQLRHTTTTNQVTYIRLSATNMTIILIHLIQIKKEVYKHVTSLSQTSLGHFSLPTTLLPYRSQPPRY